MEVNRLAKLQAIKDRWFNEPLPVQFPSLGVEMTNPSSCAEFVTSQRIITAEEDANLEHFGVADPKAILAQLSAQVAAIPGRPVPTTLRNAARVLDIFKADSENLSAQFAPNAPHHDELLHASYSADAKAAQQCQTILAALAMELGISLPVKGHGRNPG